MKGEPALKDYERTFEEFWRPIVVKDGRLSLDAVARELHDYSTLLEEVPKVYMHVTGDRISKPNTDSGAVISEHDARCEELHNGIVYDDLAELLPSTHDQIRKMSAKDMRCALLDVFEYINNNLRRS